MKAERYDTVVKKWEEIEDMLEETGDAFGEATKDKIVVAGGKHGDENSVLQNCKIYNISTNERQSSRSLIVSRMRGTQHGVSEREALRVRWRTRGRPS